MIRWFVLGILQDLPELEASMDINSVNSNNTTPLHMAAYSGHMETCKFLLRIGANKEILNFGNSANISEFAICKNFKENIFS